MPGYAAGELQNVNASSDNPNRELWYTIFAIGHPALKKFQNFHRRLPAPPRCRLCFAPFRGIGGVLMRLQKKGPNSRNPNFCNACDAFMRQYPGSAEVEMSILFADIRSSTALAEHIGATAFGNAMNNFYRQAIAVINERDGFIIGLAGDGVAAVFPPGFSGAQHSNKAVAAARDLLALRLPDAPDGSKVRLGVGVHTGPVYIGTAAASPGGPQDVAALGDNVSTTSRLSSAAAAGEAIVSEAACNCAGIAADEGEPRELTLKGKEAPVRVRVWAAS
ncbi:MAG: adenylate/guanylate cyclase domain-containing protein [Candidatus Eremiobacteraeota bacterium]|nr:adenylate/guanylate cyclase domain-containing protein [Candidatus Eremiobacteraeota bacterium]MBV8498816.1 adenylate/guanylate cyclase domain-containing protein [Candidatus Eremiobacteraeota bacterium]